MQSPVCKGLAEQSSCKALLHGALEKLDALSFGLKQGYDPVGPEVDPNLVISAGGGEEAEDSSGRES